MDHTERLTRYTAQFVDELVRNGLTDVVISPGSRSTPLALTMCEHKEVNEWVLIDERSAAFFALGMAKEKQRPVALLCTSGTAAANYFPAIIEAHYSYVPLIVLTADRPHELRDIGAPQAIEQMNLYGTYSKWFHEMALPEATPEMLVYARKQAARAVQVAKMDNPGPVHLNFPFREPLIPDFSLDDIWGKNGEQVTAKMYGGVPTLREEQLESIVTAISNKKRGLIVCGPQVDQALGSAIIKLAETLHLPVLADPLSQLRSGNHCKTHIIENYDAIFHSCSLRKDLETDYIIRFGAMPVSKNYRIYLEEHNEIDQFIVEPYNDFRNPTDKHASFICSDPHSFCFGLVNKIDGQKINENWFNKWQNMNEIASKQLYKNNDTLTEGTAVQTMLDVIPHHSSLYVGNSMAVRDLDTFFTQTDKPIKILANRGANGIDGVVSSSLGAAAGTTRHVTLLIGDLSFYHDLNGLLAAKHYHLKLTILLVNNNGGGIFSFLPQTHNKKHFETLFGTPLDIAFEETVSMYGGTYHLAKDLQALTNALANSYANNRSFSVIEIQTDRSENMQWHRQLWKSVEEAILKNGK